MARLNVTNDGDPSRQPLLPTRRPNNHNDDQHQNGTATAQKHATNDDGPKPTSTKIKTFLNTNVSSHRADIPLILSFFISGLIDAGAYNAYQCFTSMQVRPTPPNPPLPHRPASH